MPARAADVDIRLLGPIGAEREGESVALGGPRQRAVLARLGIVAGQVVTVDRLVDDVWGGVPPATAVNTLQSYVSLLRRALGDAGRLRREGPGYLLALDADQLDAGRFEDAARAGRACLDADPAAALALLDRALDEWRGPALADVADEDWARASVVRWEELRLAAVEARFDALLLLGRHAEVVGELERATDEFPLREGIARRLMIALYRTGRQADALRVFSRTRELLADELGLDPTPDLVALQTAILNHDASLAVPAGRAAPATATARGTATAEAATRGGDQRAERDTVQAGPPSPVALPGPAARAGAAAFVGRRHQLEALHEYWGRAVVGDRRLVVVSGEAGAGKSGLVARFAAEAHGGGGIVLWGRATQEAVVPFEPMVEAVRTILRTISPEARRRVAEDRGLLSLLLPELERIVPEARPSGAHPDVERYLMFETVAELLRAESARHPILVVLDDLHWADAPSLALLEHVVRHESAGQVMAVGTVRTPSADPNPDFDRMRLRLGRDGLLATLTVEGLDVGEVGELLALNGRADLDAGELCGATGGNAFYVTELLDHGGDALRVDDPPESVRNMIGQRLQRLDHVTNQVVNLVAVAGQSATLAVLTAAGGFDADRLLDAADEAVDAGLLVEDGAGRLAAPHAIVRQALLARLSRTRRLDLHRRIAEALAVDSEPQFVPSTMAYHLLEAGSLTDRTQRVTAGLEAGRRAVELAAYDDAMTWVGRVEQLVNGQVSMELQTELELLRSDTARALGDRAIALEGARLAATHARRTGPDPMLLARAAEAWTLSLSAVGFDIGRPTDDDLVDLMTDAIAALPADQRQYAVRLRSMLSSVLVGSADWVRRETLAEEAMAIAVEDGGDELVASAHLAQRLAWWRLDRLDERTDAALAAVRHANRAGNVHLELTAMLFALTDLMEHGRVDEHVALLAEFRSRSSVLRQPLYDVYATFIEAGGELSAGNYARAQRLADQALEAGLASHGVNAVFVHAGVWLRLHYDRGTLAATIPEAERMVARHPRLRMWQVGLVTAYALEGRAEDARPLFSSMVGEDGLNLRDNQLFLPVACTLVEVAEALDDPPRAAMLRQALEPYADRLAVSGLAGISIGPVARYVGIAARVSGDRTAAERFARAAVATCERWGFVPHEARARRDLAIALTAGNAPGDQEAAADERRRAERLAATVGLVLAPLPA